MPSQLFEHNAVSDFCNRGFSLRGKHFVNSVKCFRLSDLILGYTLGTGFQNLQVIQYWRTLLNPFATQPISGRTAASVFAADRDRILPEGAFWAAGRATAKSRKLRHEIGITHPAENPVRLRYDRSWNRTEFLHHVSKKTTSAFEEERFLSFSSFSVSKGNLLGYP
jgi:hypothetical protein